MENKKNSVLIVDDEIPNIMVLSRILKAEYTVYAVRSGPEAVEAAEKYQPDVILLDIIMPEMDGYDAISVLKSIEATKNIPVIFITGLSKVEDEQKGLALGAVDYIGKPFSPAIVSLRVRTQIQIINLRRSLEEAVEEAQAASLRAHNQLQIVNLREEAQADTRAKSALLADKIDELRGSVNEMTNLAELLLAENDMTAFEVNNYIEMIHISGIASAKLIDDVSANLG